MRCLWYGEKMKRLKIAFAAVLAVLLIALSAVSVCADTVYYSHGYYYSFINNDKVMLTGLEEPYSTVTVPDMLNGRVVAKIAARAFYNDAQVTGIDFSQASHLETIGMYSFAKCTSLTAPLEIPETVTTLGDSAFERSGVTEVTLNSAATYVPVQLFYGCNSLTRVTINGAPTEIDSYAFGECPVLEYVSIPASVTSINAAAFYNSPNVTLGVYSDSYAHQFAIDNNLPFELLDEFVKGDADLNGIVNVNDVTAIQRYAAEYDEFSALQLRAADIDGDGFVSVADATYIQRYLAEYADAVID